MIISINCDDSNWHECEYSTWCFLHYLTYVAKSVDVKRELFNFSHSSVASSNFLAGLFRSVHIYEIFHNIFLWYSSFNKLYRVIRLFEYPCFGPDNRSFTILFIKICKNAYSDLSETSFIRHILRNVHTFDSWTSLLLDRISNKIKISAQKSSDISYVSLIKL